jgi:hypothetical protein
MEIREETGNRGEWRERRQGIGEGNYGIATGNWSDWRNSRQGLG